MQRACISSIVRMMTHRKPNRGCASRQSEFYLFHSFRFSTIYGTLRTTHRKSSDDRCVRLHRRSRCDRQPHDLGSGIKLARLAPRPLSRPAAAVAAAMPLGGGKCGAAVHGDEKPLLVGVLTRRSKQGWRACSHVLNLTEYGI